MGWEERGMVGSEAFFASVSPSLKRIRFQEERDEWAETDVRLLTFLEKIVVKFRGLPQNKLLLYYTSNFYRREDVAELCGERKANITLPAAGNFEI